MSELKERIQRLFYPCQEDIPTDADGLLTASEQLKKYTSLIGLDAFAKLPGAILLGEGGIGKSTVMRQLESCFPQGRSRVIELGLFSGNAAGLSAVIESCLHASRSTVGTDFAVIFDGLDEAPELAGPLLLKLHELTDKATVWISSRDAPAIRAIQEDAPLLRSYMLAPLSLNDIMGLATRAGIDAERFVEAIRRGGITSICAKPIGCDLAISVFRENSLEEIKQVELWHKGITRLCDETRSATRRITPRSVFTLNDVVSCCAWMAICLTLSGKSAIWNDEESRCPDNCASLSDIQSIEFSSDLIAVSLSRGVFTPSGDGRFRFSHSTYRDYLASLGFERFIPPTHWASLLFTRKKTSVLPQRAGVATWLAARNAGFLDEISGIEPAILLTSVDAIQAIGPTTLCKALLDRSDAISYQQRHSNVVAKNLFRMSGVATCDAIRERLNDPNASDAEIDFAIEIAKSCQCIDLADLLVDRVLNQNLSYHHRVAASHAVLLLGNRSATGRLKALLPLDSVEDPMDDLRGNVLRCCWPDHLTVDELLENLSLPQRSNYLGAYGMFLDYELPTSFKEVVSEEVAGKLLRWSNEHVVRDQVLDRVGRLASRIYSYCWQWATVPAVSTLLGTGYLRALKLYRTPFAQDRGLLTWRKEPALSREEFIRDRDKRFAVLEALLRTDVDEQTLIYVPINEYPLFGPEDAGQLLEQALRDAASPLAAKWILCFKALAGRVNLGEHSQQIDKLHIARPDLIDSAFEMREHAENYARYSQEMNQRWEQQEDETKRKRESDQQRIDRGIKSVLSQRAPAAELFAEIAIWIHSEDGMTSIGSIDLTAASGWMKLSADEKESLIALAERYLREGRIEQTAPDRIAFSVAQAFLLLRLMKPDKYQSLPEEVWARSAVELLKPAFNEHMELLDPLFNALAEKFPDTAEAALIETIRQQLAVGHISILRHWGNRLSERQSLAIMRLAQDTFLKVEERYAILSALVDCGWGDAVTTYLESFLSNEWNPHPDKSLNGHLLLAFSLSPADYAPQIVKAMEADREWGRQWIESVVMDIGFGGSVASCSPDVIASMYEWLHREYPDATRPGREGGFVGPLDMIYDLKDYLIRHLSQGGIEGSSAALESIGLAFPSDRWLHDLILEAKRNEEATKLPTLSFLVIKKLREKNSASRRMVNSISDLHDLVLDKLAEYQLHLTGDTPAIGELWDLRAPVRPKSNEEDLSDHLYRFLRITMGRGLVINREVQIRRKQYSGGSPGSRTDLWIQAIAEDGQVLTLCIEVKCNWNESAKSALQEQLIDKYMSGGTAGAGILVLGWYACLDWDPTDGRLSRSTKTWPDINCARVGLDAQRAQLQKGKYYVSASVIDCSLL